MEDYTMSDNPYYRELVDFRQTLQNWVTGLTPAAGENVLALNGCPIKKRRCLRQKRSPDNLHTGYFGTFLQKIVIKKTAGRV